MRSTSPPHLFALLPFGLDGTVPAWWLVLSIAVTVLVVVWSGSRRRRAHAVPSADHGTQLESHFELSLVGITRTSLDGKRILGANTRAAELYGYDSVEEFLRIRPKDIHSTPEQREEMLELLHSKGRIESMEAVFRVRDGSLLPLAVSSVLDEKNGYVETVLIDMRHIRRVEQELKEQRNFLQALLDAMPNPFFYKTPDGRYRLVNNAFEEMLGISPEDILGKSVYDVSPKELADKYQAMDDVLFKSKGRAIQRYEHQVRSGDGLRDVMFSKESLFGADGENKGLVGVITDISRLRRAEKELETTKERFRALFMNAAEGIFVTSADGRFLEANPAFARLLGYDSPEELIDTVEDVAKQVYAHPEQRVEWLERLQREGLLQGLDQELLRKDCSRVWVSLSLRGEFDEDGNLVRLLGLATDISERKRFEEQLRQLATTDSLTSLPNRMQFESAVQKMIAQAERSGEQLAVLYLDLDGFKEINDTWGHEVGDKLLVQVADRMRSRLRESDLGARIGGDEFAVLLWNVGGYTAAEAVGKDLSRELSRTYHCNGTPCEVGASIGAALYPQDGKSLRELLDRADKAMYAVKSQGKSGLAMASARQDADS